MLIDEVTLNISAGHGGPGKASFFKKERGPDGGNGGRGGDFYLQATSDLTALSRFASQTEFSAQNGFPGESNKKFGLDGKDSVLTIPIGTEITDIQTKEQFELTQPETKILICKGGLGGKGNFELRAPWRTTPLHAQHGLPGQTRQLHLVLRFIADVGLIGLPNAGKSSLLNSLTNAQAKIGNYPFTTLEPNLGVYNQKILADIPGLIEGASAGKGLGTKFLKHIEKVSILLHCVDSSSLKPWEDYQIVRQELEKYNPQLIKKKEFIILTKSDLSTPDDIKTKLSVFTKHRKKSISVSVIDEDSLNHLKKLILSNLPTQGS